MTALNKQALRGQSVEGSYYLAECGHCGEMYPSNKLDGGEPLFSGDYGECFCHLCGADDSDIADNGAWGSEAVIAWNYQQKRIEALLDELVAKDRLNAELIEKQRLIDICQGQGLEHRIAAEKRAEAAEKRIAELEARTASVNLPDERVNDAVLNKFCRNSRDLLVCVIARELRAYRDAGIGVKGEQLVMTKNKPAIESMSLDAAIAHADERAAALSGPCAEQHAQLASWLRELQENRKTAAGIGVKGE